MAINKATLAKEVDGVIEYIYPKTSGDIVVYDDTHSVSAMISSLTTNKLDKEDGKGLSTNDFTNELYSKLNSIEAGATSNVVDSALSSTSTNAVQNRVVYERINSLTENINNISDEVNQTVESVNGRLDNISEEIAGDLGDLGDNISEAVLNLNNNKEKKHTFVNYTLRASNWNNSVYSIENIYPGSEYLVSLIRGVLTEEQSEALSLANINGTALDSTVNQFVALGEVPVIDIPMILEIVEL